MKLNEMETQLVITLGPSGRGKSTAISTLDPLKTVIFNTENKPLPFREAKDFKNVVVESSGKLLAFLIEASTREDIEVIVIDSFSAWLDHLMNYARLNYKNYEIFNHYNEQIYSLFQIIRRTKKYVILIAHDEILTDGDGATVKRVKVQGNKWEGLIEKEANIVLYANVAHTGETGENSYYFETQSDGKTSAKSPRGMFDSFTIPNDYGLVISKIKEYYNYK